jgi:transmembrane sensor
MTSAIDIEHQAAEWLVRLESPDRTPEQLGEFEAWLARNPRHRAAFQRLKAGWVRADALSRLRPLDGSVDENLLDALRRDRKTEGRHGSPVSAGLALAAGVALAACLLFTWRAWPQLAWHAYGTGSGGFERVVLPDESIVYLNSNSAMRVRFREDRREVVLERGEAMFEVAADKARPFVVHAGDAHLQALSTAFTVRLHDHSHVDVIVTEGRVAVTELGRNTLGSDQTSPTATLSAGETITIRADRVHIGEVKTGQLNERLSWIPERMGFERKTLAEVAGEFNRYNHDQLVIADPRIGRLRMEGTFDTRDIDSFVVALERTFGIRATASVDDEARTIVLTGPEETDLSASDGPDRPVRSPQPLAAAKHAQQSGRPPHSTTAPACRAARTCDREAIR